LGNILRQLLQGLVIAIELDILNHFKDKILKKLNRFYAYVYN